MLFYNTTNGIKMNNQMPRVELVAGNIPPPARLRRAEAAPLPPDHAEAIVMTEAMYLEYCMYHSNTAANEQRLNYK